MKVRTMLAALTALAAVLTLGAGSASAAFPGSNGKIAFAMDISPTDPDPAPADHEIFTINPDGTGLTRLTTWSGSDVDPAWNHQGTRLAFVNLNSSWPGLYTMNGDGSSVRRLTIDPNDRAPAWSPDGRTLVFTRGPDLFMINADGSGARRVVQAGTNDVRHFARQPAWSPDGNTIAFTCGQNGGSVVCLLDIPTGNVRWLVFGSDPAWSPDGEWIAYVDITLGNAEIFAIRVEGPGKRRVTDSIREDLEPAWSPDGTKIVYTSRYYGFTKLYMINSDGSGRQPLIGGLWASDGMPDWQPRVKAPGPKLLLP